MKTVLISALALAVAAPAFADDGLEGRILLPGERNDVTVTEQLAAGHTGMDAVTLIALNAAEADDDALGIYALRTAPETVSTQNVATGAGAQLLAGIGSNADAMSVSAAAAAYLDEVSDD